MSILEKYHKKNFPCGRLPTMAECVDAIEHPENAEWWVNEYLRLRPEFVESLRSILEFEKNITENPFSEGEDDGNKG